MSTRNSTSSTDDDEEMGDIVVNLAATIRPYSGDVVVVSGIHRGRHGSVLSRHSTLLGFNTRQWRYSVQLFATYDRQERYVLQPEETVSLAHDEIQPN